MTTDLRPSPIAGTWYPGEATLLRQEIDRYLAQAKVSCPEGELRAIIVPHAGYRYSGPVAAYAFKCLQGLRPELVVVVSPMHHPYRAPLLTSGHDAYLTPLGEVAIDHRAVETLNRQLQTRLGYRLTPVLNDPEHALEIELPFLQRVVGDFSLLPVMIRDQTAFVARELGHALADTVRARDALLVASSDLSHFYPQHIAEKLDREMLRRVEAFDPAGVMRAEEEGVGFACGRSAIAAVMWAARELGANRARVLHYATSGNVTGDYASVVGYGAAAIVRERGR